MLDHRADGADPRGPVRRPTTRGCSAATGSRPCTWTSRYTDEERPARAPGDAARRPGRQPGRSSTSTWSTTPRWSRSATSPADRRPRPRRRPSPRPSRGRRDDRRDAVPHRRPAADRAGRAGRAGRAAHPGRPQVPAARRGPRPLCRTGCPPTRGCWRSTAGASFGYRSVYFDTAGLHSYLAAAHRPASPVQDPDPQLPRLRTCTCSRSRPADRAARPSSSGCPYAGDGDALDRRGRRHVGTLLPGLGVDPAWPRSTRADHPLPPHHAAAARDRSRVTIDTDLVWSLPDGRGLGCPDRGGRRDQVRPRPPPQVDRLLWSLGHRPAPISKYGTGLAALRPELPANRWHRVLRRHFAHSRHPDGSDPPMKTPHTARRRRRRPARSARRRVLVGCASRHRRPTAHDQHDDGGRRPSTADQTAAEVLAANTAVHARPRTTPSRRRRRRSP